MADPTVAIFTLTKDRRQYTERMLSILRARTSTPFDHYVIDNGSTDGTQELLEATRDNFAGLVLNTQNMGISGGSNQALDLIGDRYDYIIKLDNDCEILSDDWLAGILAVAQGLGNRAILSPYVEGLNEHRGGVARYENRTVAGHPVGLTHHLGGISCIAPTEAYRGFRFNERYALRGNQDLAFSKYVASKGFLIGYVEDVRVLHMEGTLGQHERYPEYFALAEKERWTVAGNHTAVDGVRLRLVAKLKRVAERLNL